MGKLVCSHYMSYSKAFTLWNGHKIVGLIVIECFYPDDHPYRNDKHNFTSGVTEGGALPPKINNEDIF